MQKMFVTDKQFSFSKTYRSSTTQTKKPKVTKLVGEAEGAKMFRQLLELAKLLQEAENLKEILVEKEDYTFGKAFKLFDCDGKGHLIEFDVKYGFNNLGIYPTEVELKNFMKRNKYFSYEMITYIDFCKLLLPRDKKYHSIMRTKQSVSTNKSRFLLFNYETSSFFTNLLKKVIKLESLIEELKGTYSQSMIRTVAKQEFSFSESLASLSKRRGSVEDLLRDCPILVDVIRQELQQ